jgi:hypothetical protein
MMRQRLRQSKEAGQDSFLDIVTNIVGILIILVMVIGARVQSLSVNSSKVPQPEVATLTADAQRLDDSVVLAESELLELTQQADQLAIAIADAGTAQIHMATALSAEERDIARLKKVVDEERVSLAEAEARREQLEEEVERCSLEADGIENTAQKTERLLAYPTPIGRTVTGDEILARGDAVAG